MLAFLLTLAAPLPLQTACFEETFIEQGPSPTAGGFGLQIGLLNGKALLGAPFLDGAACVFRQQGSDWLQEAKFTNPTGVPLDQFGFGVSLSLPYAMVGAPGDDTLGTNQGAVIGEHHATGTCAGSSCSSVGAAYVLRQNNGVRSVQQRLTPSASAPFLHYGTAVAIEGTTILVGATGDDDVAPDGGALYVYDLVGTQWVETQKLAASDAGPGHHFGAAVEISGSQMWVAANQPSCCIGPGYVYVFSHDGTSWTERGTLRASNGAAYENFGVSLFESNGTLLVGASRAGLGTVYEFDAHAGTATMRGAAANPDSYTASVPTPGKPWMASVDLTTTGHTHAQLVGFASPASAVLPGGQVALAGGARLFSLPARPGPLATWSLPIPADCSIRGVGASTQALHFGGAKPYALSNAVDLVVGY